MDGKTLIDALQDAGHEPKSYSGRGMYGKTCVSVNLDSVEELWRLARAIDQDLSVKAPETDSMGYGVVAYWPDAEWPEDLSDEDEDEDIEEGGTLSPAGYTD